MFNRFSKAVYSNYVKMSEGELFVVEAPEDLFEQYLGAFPEGSNPVFRKRTVYDCQCCKRFIKWLGVVVSIDKATGKVTTVWDNINSNVDRTFAIVAEKMGEIIRNCRVIGVFRTKERKYGIDHNYDNVTNEKYEHFWGEVSDRHYKVDPDKWKGEINTIFQVCQRGLSEIKLDDLDTVLDLINNNGLYRGEEHKAAILGFKGLLTDYKSIVEEDKENFIWANLDNRFARFKNTVIGELLVLLGKGVELEVAVRAFETRVAPTNYKRPTAVITQRMVEQAVQTLTDLGLGGAIYRRFARISDVSVNDVLFVSNDGKAKMKDGIVALLENSVVKGTPDLKRAVKISADSFVKEVLTGATKVEVFVENRHVGNFVSLTAPKDNSGEGRLFKWNNNFGWSYDGDVTDSVKQRVKAAGGNINCKLRISLSWYNFDDLDLHCKTPNGTHVHYAQKSGILDVDMNAGFEKSRNAVENLAFNNCHLMDGVYRIWVNQFNRRETDDIGFAIEVEYNGIINQYSYGKTMRTGDNVECLMLTVRKGELVNIEVDKALSGGTVSKEKMGS